MRDHSEEYERYIQSTAWRRRREAYFRFLGKRECESCGTTRRLHVHHRTYKRMGHELDQDLNALCEACHDRVHRLHRESNGRLTLVEATDKVLSGFVLVPVKAPKKSKKKAKKRREDDFFYLVGKRERQSAPKAPHPVGGQRNGLEIIDDAIRAQYRSEGLDAKTPSKDDRKRSRLRRQRNEALWLVKTLMVKCNRNPMRLSASDLNLLNQAKRTLKKTATIT